MRWRCFQCPNQQSACRTFQAVIAAITRRTLARKSSIGLESAPKRALVGTAVGLKARTNVRALRHLSAFVSSCKLRSHSRAARAGTSRAPRRLSKCRRDPKIAAFPIKIVKVDSNVTRRRPQRVDYTRQRVNGERLSQVGNTIARAPTDHNGFVRRER